MKGERDSRNSAEMIKEGFMGKEACEIDFDTEWEAAGLVGAEAWNKRVSGCSEKSGQFIL